MAQASTQSAEILRPYAPRLLIRWLAEQPHLSFRTLEGSMVFVDISGFTKMSERLARHGKVGAEEVTEVLGAVFAKLLAVAYGEDGSLLKFGGDALLLWFSGTGHAARAATAAHGMRGTLRSVGRLDTTAGKVVLRMSVGVQQRHVPLLPRGRVAPGVHGHRSGGEPHRGHGVDGDRGRDPPQPGHGGGPAVQRPGSAEGRGHPAAERSGDPPVPARRRGGPDHLDRHRSGDPGGAPGAPACRARRNPSTGTRRSRSSTSTAWTSSWRPGAWTSWRPACTS